MAESADTKHQQPSAYDSTCVAARTRPLVSCRRRRLVQPNTVPNLNGKVGDVSDMTVSLGAGLKPQQESLHPVGPPPRSALWVTGIECQGGALSLTCVRPQAQRSSCTSCNCRVNPSCVMCGGWPTPREDPQFELPTLERLSRLDLGLHPILSFPDGQCWVYADISSSACRGEDKQGVAAICVSCSLNVVMMFFQPGSV